MISLQEYNKQVSTFNELGCLSEDDFHYFYNPKKLTENMLEDFLAIVKVQMSYNFDYEMYAMYMLGALDND